jgi:hypothetical protein
VSREDEGHGAVEDLMIPGARAGAHIRWRDPTCPHSTTELRRDLARHVCLDCGRQLAIADPWET